MNVSVRIEVGSQTVEVREESVTGELGHLIGAALLMLAADPESMVVPVYEIAEACSVLICYRDDLDLGPDGCPDVLAAGSAVWVMLEKRRVNNQQRTNRS